MFARQLTPKQELFVLEFLKDYNATKAAIRAGYARRSANREGTRLLSNAVILKKIDEAREERKERIRIDTDRVEREIEQIAFSDVRKLFGPGGLLPIDELPGPIAAAVASFRVSQRVSGRGVRSTTKVRFWDKLSALRMLVQMRGLAARTRIAPSCGPEHAVAVRCLTQGEIRRAAELAAETIAILDRGYARARARGLL